MQVLLVFSIFTNSMGNNLQELKSKMITFANPIKLFRVMKVTSKEVCFHEVCN